MVSRKKRSTYRAKKSNLKVYILDSTITYDMCIYEIEAFTLHNDDFQITYREDDMRYQIKFSNKRYSAKLYRDDKLIVEV